MESVESVVAPCNIINVRRGRRGLFLSGQQSYYVTLTGGSPESSE